jgi:RNA polymerase sigma-70 factor (ECF subfamily)
LDGAVEGHTVATLGPIEAFASIYRQHWPYVFGFFSRRVAAVEDAEDLAAMTFLVAWRRFDEMPAGPAGRHWLVSVARHSLANYWRGNARRNRLVGALRAYSQRDAAASLAEDVGSGSGVIGAFMELSPGHQEALWLVACEGLSHDEVAQRLGCSRQALDNRLSRARAALRLRLVSRGGRDARSSEDG